MSDSPNKIVELNAADKSLLIERKVTCPFIGSAINIGLLDVHHDAQNPLASIEDVRRIGNRGGGDLGDLLVVFASGNHAFMRGDSENLNRPVPSGMFSLELPGSQGSHPGHSGILEGDPTRPGSGRFSEANFARLTSRAHEGWIKRSDVGRFIAENLFNDPQSKVFGKNTVTLLAGDLLKFVEATGPALLSRIFGSAEDANAAHREMDEKFTKLLGEDNLVGAAGEFGLLFAFLANKPGAKEVGGEPAVSVDDLKTMFVEKHFPNGWDTWKKTRIDWVKHTTGLLISAGKEYHILKSAK